FLRVATMCDRRRTIFNIGFQLRDSPPRRIGIDETAGGCFTFPDPQGAQLRRLFSIALMNSVHAG
ncbi:MAG TPA: hypothetical protein VNQ76_16265, partial [Planctomicrobium sp.]|nr:hypothetical protein [Planctomicrobium sp.]